MRRHLVIALVRFPTGFAVPAFMYRLSLIDSWWMALASTTLMVLTMFCWDLKIERDHQRARELARRYYP